MGLAFSMGGSKLCCWGLWTCSFSFPVVCNFDDSSELDIRLMYISLFVDQEGVRSFWGVSC